MIEKFLPEHIDQLETFPAGSEVLVRDLVNGKIHVLNTTAAEILEMCNGRNDAAVLTAHLAAGSNVERSTVAADIQSLLEEFQRLGLLKSRLH
ncbi:MAG: HPr-rel-A system PqqD family peptide chaperone [Candidatus Eremiobacteraeota bacterium]|nr:HPr-rel-A system PqqD family peptide chaperone [Candidatus Eremiobacteraeota bacterium]